MAETTLKEQLSGNEIIEAVVDKVRAKLRGDCYLNPNSAYDWFTAKINIELDMHDTGQMVPTNHEVKAESGAPPEDEDEIQHVRDGVEIEAAAPNTVRVESGQGVPTRAKDEQGREVVKHVHYKRTDARKVAP